MTGIDPKTYDALLMPLNGNRVSMLQGKFSYLEAWDVKRYLIRFFGFGGFDSVVEHQEIVNQRERYSTKKDEAGKVDGWHVTAMVRLRLTIHNVVPIYGYHPEPDLGLVIVGYGPASYVEVACATNSGSTLGDCIDTAVKSAESDALKRAAINLGTQFGLSLYQDGSKEDVVMATLRPPVGWIPPAEREQEVPPVLPTDVKQVKGTAEGTEPPVPSAPPVPGEASDDAPNAPEDQGEPSPEQQSERVTALADRIREAAKGDTVAKRMAKLNPIVAEVTKTGAKTWVVEDGTTIGRMLDLALSGKLGADS